MEERSMKKYLYSTLAIAAALLVSCSVKEEPVEVEEPVVEPTGGEYITIIGNVPENPISKTAYDFSSGTRGEFSWVSTDKIALIVKYRSSSDPLTYDINHIDRYQLGTSAGAITDGGKTAVFSGLLDHDTEGDEWLSTGFAVYPVALSQQKTNSGYDAVYVKIPSTVSGQANSIYLVGTPNDPTTPTNYSFKTAMGVFQVTLNHIPDEAKYIRLVTADKTAYPLDGDFELEVGGDGAVSIGVDQFLDTWVSSFAGYLQVDVSALADDATATYYFNIPVNDYPANTLSLQVVAEDGYVMETKTIKTAISVARGTVYPLPTLNLSREWKYLGVGKFADNVLEEKLGISTGQFVDVRMFQSYDNSRRFRLADPFQNIYQLKSLNAMVHNDMEFTIFSSGEDFFSTWSYTAPEDDVIRFNLLGNAAGAINNGWSGYNTYRIYHPFWNKDQDNYPWTLNRVLSYNAGAPKWVQLAYIYDMNGSKEDHSHHAGTAQIVMPGFDVPDWGSVTRYNGFTADPKVKFEVDLGDATSMDFIVLSSAPDFKTAHTLYVGTDPSIVSVSVSGEVEVPLPSSAVGTYYLVRRAYINGQACDDQYEAFDYDGVTRSRIDLTSSMISVSIDAGNKDGSAQYDGGGKAALVDNDVATFWHTPYYDQATLDSYKAWFASNYGVDADNAYTYDDLDATYGAYIDIDLGAGNEITDFEFEACLRNGSGDFPVNVKIFTKVDDSSPWVEVEDVTDIHDGIAAGQWVDPITCSAANASRYIRFAILSSTGGTLLDPAAANCTHLAEIRLFEQ